MSYNYQKIIRTMGETKEFIREKINDVINQNLDIVVTMDAIENTVVDIIVSVNADNKENATIMIKDIEKLIRNELSNYNCIYGTDNDTIEDVVGRLLVEENLTISTAESCTGGLLAGTLINFPGISSVFMDGVVSYSNESKMKRLGVCKETLDSFGAVSEQVAKEMAKGIADTAGTKIGISTTGIAGPTGGTDEKPVGLVYIGLYMDGIITAKKLNLSGNRRYVREKTVKEALDLLKHQIINYQYSKKN